MWKYIVRRILIAVPMLLLISLIIFILANLMPGDAVNAMFAGGEGDVSNEAMAQMRENMGLNDPWIVRYFRWLTQLLRGNLGMSTIMHQPVAEMIRVRIGPTLALMGSSLVFSIIIGVALGIFSSMRQYTLADYVLTIFSFIGRSVPVFFVGMFFIYWFALQNPIFPTGGMHDMGVNTFADLVRHMFLPGLSLSVLRAAEFMRYSRASMLEVLHSDFVWTARSKGIPERRVITRHVFGNAMIPVITLVGINIPVLFSGAIMIEQLFQWPGIGTLFNMAVSQRDYSLLMGLCFLSSVIVLASNLLTDIAYAIADPRIRYN